MKVNTKYGEMDEEQLTKATIESLDGRSYVQYFLNGELVHSSSVVRLTGLSAQATARDLTR